MNKIQESFKQTKAYKDTREMITKNVTKKDDKIIWTLFKKPYQNEISKWVFDTTDADGNVLETESFETEDEATKRWHEKALAAFTAPKKKKKANRVS